MKNILLVYILLAVNFLFGGFWNDDIYDIKSYYHNHIYKDPQLVYNKNIYKVTSHPIYQLIAIKNSIDDNVHYFTHDDKGNVISNVSSNSDFGESVYYTYDTSGNILSTYRDVDYAHLDLHHFNYINNTLSKDTLDYNGDGQFIEIRNYAYINNQITITTSDESTSFEEKYIFNSNHFAINNQINGQISESYAYDSNGNIISRNNSYYPCQYSYNGNNKRILTQCHRIDNDTYFTETFTYNNKGKMTSRTVSDNTVTMNGITQENKYKQIFTYDTDNNLILEEYDDNNDGSINATSSYVYDKDRNLIRFVQNGIFGNYTNYLTWKNTKEDFSWLSAIYNIILQ